MEIFGKMAVFPGGYGPIGVYRVKLRRPKTEKYKRSLAYKGPHRWDSLPSHLHHLSTRAQFVHRLQLHLKLTYQSNKMVLMVLMVKLK